MNKTDMSNPDQCSLSGSLCCTKEADKLRHAMKGWVEMSGSEARERGGGGEGWGGGSVPESRSTAVQSVATEPGCFESPENS